jgi:hypothetical protein
LYLMIVFRLLFVFQIEIKWTVLIH